MHIRALEWVDRFQRYLTTERRVSPHTTSNYGRDIAALVAHCDREGLQHWHNVLVPEVRRFAAHSHAGGLSPQSVQRRLSAVRTFMRFLVHEGVIGGNYAEVVQAPKAVRKLPSVLDVDQMTRLIEIPGSDALSIRDRAIMELLYSSALRLIELVRLDCSNLDIPDRTLRVLGKGSKVRIVPVGSYAVAAIQRWLPVRRKLAKPDETALFVGRGGRRLGPRLVQTRIAMWARQQRIGMHVHPHLFRHSAATHLLESSGAIREIQDYLGHANISTTQIYTHLDIAHVVRVYAATHPRSSRKPEVAAKGAPPTPIRVASESALPCDGCPHTSRCGAEGLACTAFEKFSEGLPWDLMQRNDATRKQHEMLFDGS